MCSRSSTPTMPSATRARPPRWQCSSRRHVAFVALALILGTGCAAEPPATDGAGEPRATTHSAADAIDAADLSRITRELSADSFQGRGPAGPGEAPTLEYLENAYRDLGLVPMGDARESGGRSYLQEVPMVGITADPRTASLSFKGPGLSRQLQYGPEFVAWTESELASVEVETPLVFVGYGVVAPEEEWDDYADTDVSGKVVVMLVNDPPHPDDSRFGGEAMTYYGRWTYKYEEAARQGAAGALLIHTTESAGYGWNVVESSWSGEQFGLPPAPGSTSPVPLQGWITSDVARSLFEDSGHDLSELRARAAEAPMEPVELGVTVRAHLDNEFRRIISYNVLGTVEGDDPEVVDEHVLVTAHWDHLGVGSPVDGDEIYNGAMDNATGVAALLEIAEAFATRQPGARRSALFIATTAEEQGLLGATWYTQHPAVPPQASLAVINIDGLNVWGPTEDVTVIGLGNTTLDDLLAEVLEDQGGRTPTPDPEPEQGYFYRSDHFPFAKVGIPALYTDTGVRFAGRPPEYAVEVRAAYRENHYHQPSDEFDPDWDFTGAAEDVRALYRVALRVAQTHEWPEWTPGTEFKAIRERSLQQGS